MPVSTLAISLIMCLPIKNFNGQVTIASLCDATELNKQYNLTVNEKGCAVPGQAIPSENAMMLHQAPVEILADNEEDLAEMRLKTCEIKDAGIILDIELPPWQQ